MGTMLTEREQPDTDMQLVTDTEQLPLFARVQRLAKAIVARVRQTGKRETPPTILVWYLRLKRDPGTAAAAILTIVVFVCSLLTLLEVLVSDRVPTVVWVCFMLSNYLQGQGSN